MDPVFVSKRPFLVPAYYNLLVASGLKPHIVVMINYPGVCVPQGYDEDGRIVLNIDPDAVRHFTIDDQWIIFDAIFHVQPETVRVPMGSIVLMFASDTGWFIDFSDDAQPTVESVPVKKNKFKKDKSIFRIVSRDSRDTNEDGE